MVVERAVAAREQALQLRDRSVEIHARCRGVLGARLAARTARVATGRGADLDPIHIVRLSAALGRDPAIEDAKRLLCERHGLTGAEEFELLRRVSQHRNRKLRGVARDVLSSAP